MSESGFDCPTKENEDRSSESMDAKIEQDDESDEEIDTFVRGSTSAGDPLEVTASDEPLSAEKTSIEQNIAESQNFENENVQESTRSETTSEEQASQTSEIESCASCELVKAEYDLKIQDVNNSLVLLNAKIVKKEDELAMWKKKFEDKCVEAKASTQKIQGELTARLDKALRMLEAVKNEKEAAVMKYVVVEQEIAAKEKAVDISERRRLHCEKEAVQANEKAKHMQIERTKFRQLVEDKENELIFARKEHDKLKCDNATLMQKVKGLEGRLQKETEAHAETQSKVAILNQKLREVKEEFDSIKKQSQDLVKAYKSLDIEKNETAADDSIKSCASSESDISSLDDSTPNSHKSNLSIKDEQLPGTKFAGHFHAKDFEFLKRMQHCSVIEITSLRDQLSASKKDATAMQLCVREKTEELMVKEAEISTLKSRLDAYAVLETELETEKNRRVDVEEKRQKEEALVNECEERINEYQNREKSNLEYTTKLTNKITQLQMELQDKGRDCEKLQKETEALKDQISEAKQSTAADYDQQIIREKENKRTEMSRLSKILEEKESRIAQLILDFEEKENKWNIEKRKLDAVLKDTNRQLQSMKKLKESVESELQAANEALKQGSENSSPWHNSSNSSKLDNGSKDLPADESNSDSNTWDLNHNSKTATFNNQGSRTAVKGHATSTTIEKQSNVARSNVDKGHDMSSLVCASVEIAQPFKRGIVPKSSEGVNSFSEKWTDKYPGLDKNIVVEKLIKIQKQQKKLIEKSEVMEDQVFQLTEELKKKNKVIQYYVLREETGTLGSAAGNDTLLFNKIYSQKLASAQNSSMDHRRSSNPASKLSSLFSPSNGASMHQTSSDGPGSGICGDPINPHFYKDLNTRLQSVLEDTILKNMKLQENLDIMSSEVQSLKSAAVVATSSVTEFPLETPTSFTSSFSPTSSNSSGTTARTPSTTTTTNGNNLTSHVNNNHPSSHLPPLNSTFPLFEQIASSSVKNANGGDVIHTPLASSRTVNKGSEQRWSAVTADDLLRN